MHGCICSDTVIPEWWSLPTHRPPHPQKEWKHFVLTGFTTSDYSRHLSALPREEVKRQALQQLDDMFGTPSDPKPATNSFMDWATKDWGNDRFIKTGYTSVSMQSSEVDRQIIGAPVSGSRVFFAGEHCGVGRCMVAQAAIETGIDAGRAAVQAVKRLPQLPESEFVPPMPAPASVHVPSKDGTLSIAPAAVAPAIKSKLYNK
jgi:monoamine oxidase